MNNENNLTNMGADDNNQTSQLIQNYSQEPKIESQTNTSSSEVQQESVTTGTPMFNSEQAPQQSQAAIPVIDEKLEKKNINKARSLMWTSYLAVYLAYALIVGSIQGVAEFIGENPEFGGNTNIILIITPILAVIYYALPFLALLNVDKCIFKKIKEKKYINSSNYTKFRKKLILDFCLLAILIFGFKIGKNLLGILLYAVSVVIMFKKMDKYNWDK